MYVYSQCITTVLNKFSRLLKKRILPCQFFFYYIQAQGGIISSVDGIFLFTNSFCHSCTRMDRQRDQSYWNFQAYAEMHYKKEREKVQGQIIQTLRPEKGGAARSCGRALKSANTYPTKPRKFLNLPLLQFPAPFSLPLTKHTTDEGPQLHFLQGLTRFGVEQA